MDRFVFGSAAIIRSHGRYLMQLRDDRTLFYPAHWGLFGGHKEEGETTEETLRRELHEELDFWPKKLEYRGMYSEFDPNLKQYQHRSVYTYDGDHTVADFTLGEGKGLAFLNPEHALRLKLCYADRKILEDYFEEEEGWVFDPHAVRRGTLATPKVRLP